jgi:hypothetical protein
MDGKATEIMVTLQLIQAAVPNFRCYPVVVMICDLSTARTVVNAAWSRL